VIPLVIAHNTFRETTRDRVLVGVMVAGLALYGMTQVVSPLALGEGSRLTVDLGLSIISTLGVLVVMLVGTSLVGKEIEKRTLYNLLSRPIARHQYLIGKWAGLSAALWVLCAGLAVALCAVLALRGSAGHAPAVLEAAYLTALELTVVTAVAVLFSALSTPVLSALYTLGIYVLGHWTYDLRVFAAQFPSGLGKVVEVAASLLPNLPVFNMRTLAAAGDTTTLFHLAIATVYALTYCACALALATAAFESRDFK
jgi:ABC-type transport system involved in multi-copper enzyme maturation permease subunit